MKRLFLIILLVFNLIKASAQFTISPALGIGISPVNDNDAGQIELEVDYLVSEIFQFGLVGEYQYEPSLIDRDEQKYLNLVFEVKTDIMYLLNKWQEEFDLYLDTGFGLGHHFTDAMVDHNYHTYRVGLDLRFYNEYRTFGGIVRTGLQSHSYAEHIGFLPEYNKIYATVGFCIQF